MAENKVSVEITLEEKAALKALTQLTKDINKTEASFTKMGHEGDEALGIVGEAADGVKDGFRSLVGGVTVANLASEAIIGTANAIKNFALNSVNAAIEAENSQNRLAQALRATNSFSEEAVDDFNAYAIALSQVSKFTDDAILEQIAVAKSMGATNEQAKNLVRAAAELDATFGGGLDANVEKLGKTLSGTAGRLAQVIPGFKDLTAEQLRSGEAIDLVNSKYSGASASQLESFGGKVALLTKSFGELQEAIGLLVVNSGVSNAFTTIADAINLVNQAMSDNAIIAQRQAGGFTETGASLEQLQRQYEEMAARAVDLEQKILFPSTNMDQTAIFIAKKQLAELNAEIARTKTLIDQSAPKVAAGQASSSASGGALLPADQATVDSRNAMYAALQQSYVEQAAWEAEQDLMKREITTANYQAELDQLVGIEQAKVEAKFAAEEEKAKIIQDSQTRQLALQKVQVDKEMALESSKLAAKKKIDAQFLQFQQQTQQANAQLIGAGFGLAATIAKEGTKEQFLIQKAGAIAQAVVATQLGAAQALALGPILGPPLAAKIEALGAINVGTIVATAIKGYEQGGIIPGSSMTGDRIPAMVNSGEMILNRQQQGELFRMANGGGNSSQMMEKLEALMSAIANQPIIISVDGRAIAVAVRKEVQGGFRIA